MNELKSTIEENILNALKTAKKKLFISKCWTRDERLWVIFLKQSEHFSSTQTLTANMYNIREE